MSQILLMASGNFRGIVAAPSGATYNIVPGEAVTADVLDEVFLRSYGLTSAAPPVDTTGEVGLSVTLLTSGSGNFTVPETVTHLNGLMTGGGGGGGGVTNAAATAAAGAPGILVGFFMKVTPGQVIAYSIGAGGIAGTNAGGNGGDAGDTTFGDFTSKGGGGGTGSTSGNATAQSGAAFSAQINGSSLIPNTTRAIVSQEFITNTGGAGSATGGGGRGFWGVGGTGGTSAAGGNATGFGASGGGAGSNSTGAFIGGTGSGGAILLTY